jgi:hypothetical protein
LFPAAAVSVKTTLLVPFDKTSLLAYVQVTKSVNGKITYTYPPTQTGRTALEKHWMTLDKLRAATKSKSE